MWQSGASECLIQEKAGVLRARAGGVRHESGGGRGHKAHRGFEEHPKNFGFYFPKPTGKPLKGVKQASSTIYFARLEGASGFWVWNGREGPRAEAGGHWGGCGRVSGKTVVIWTAAETGAWRGTSGSKGILGHSEPCLSRKEKGCPTKETCRALGQILSASYCGTPCGLWRAWIQVLSPHLPWATPNSQACRYCLFPKKNPFWSK